MISLKEVLGLFDPATSIEIVNVDGNSIYRGVLLNLGYCEVGEMLDYSVDGIRMKNEEHGYRVVIIISNYLATVSMEERE